MAYAQTVDVHGYEVQYSEELGRGAFGTVYKGLNPNGEVIAIKKISTGTREDKRKASMEAMKLHYLKDKNLHRNEHISRIDDVKYWQNAAWIMMEYCDLGDLNRFFKDHGQFVANVDIKFKLMRQIINGIAFLHERNIVHRDIKPGNILLKLSPDRHAVVKLGDFGLSKILDPDSLTSAMSSNVGTLSFKAPEFWDTAPDADGRVTYHRNVDVYAAGLTFAALLQAKPARSLMPKPEGSMYPGEDFMPIGLAAHNRKMNKHPDVNIVKHQPNDSQLVKIIKSIIMEMTHVSPNQRLSATVIENKLQDPVLLPRGSSTLAYFTDCVCLVEGKLAIREFNLDMNNYSLKLFNFESNSTENAWISRCPHYLRCGLLLSACPENNTSMEVDNLLEGCPHPDCRVIRCYDTKSGESSVVFEDVQPYYMCLGPPGHFFMFDRTKGSLLQLGFRYGGLLLVQERKVNFQWFQGMTYSAVSRCVIVSHCNGRQIMSINMETGDVEWQTNSWVDMGLEPEDVCASPNGWVWVASGGTVRVLDARKGYLVDVPSLALDRQNPDEKVQRATAQWEDSPRRPKHSGDWYVRKMLWSPRGSTQKLVVAYRAREEIKMFDVSFSKGPIIIEESQEEP